MNADDFGDRMKLYEQAEAGRHLMPLLPAIARLDGKSFHTWTEGLDRPFDKRLIKIMQDVTKVLVEQTGALIGYTQSDEISLVFYSNEISRQLYFDGNIQKLVSVLASIAAVNFNNLANSLWVKAKTPALFDCRVWNVPNKVEAANALLWREQDAAKNSVSMAARALFDHKDLMNKSGPEMQEMMFSQHKVNWNDYPACCKRGTFIQPRKVLMELDPKTLEKIPEKHRPAPGTKYERTRIEIVDMPIFSKVVNRVEVVFEGAEPKTL
jgi:tRNA(His) guanylyltransferase